MTRAHNVALWRVLTAGFVACAAANLPGHLSYDSVLQLNEGRRGFYANWHPPMMSWLLGVFDRVWPGTSLFTLFDLALLFGSLGALAWLRARTARAATIVLVLCLLTPQFLLYQGIVWKDVLFADLAIAGFAALAVAGEKWQQPRFRFGFAAACVLILSVATLVRQNGGVVLPPAIAAIGWLAWKQTRARRIRLAALYALCATIGSAAAVAGMHSALALRIPGDPSPTVQFRLLQFYDLIGALKAEPSLPLRAFDEDDPVLEYLMRKDGVRLYTPERNDTLANSASLQRAYFASPGETIPEEWRNLIRKHTALYLRVRAQVFRWVVLTPNLPACRPVFTGIEGRADVMKKVGLARRYDLRDGALDHYARLFENTPIFSHAFYIVSAAFLMLILFARRRASDIVMGAMLASAFLFVASFFVIAIACDYRYLYFLDLATMVAAFHVALDWRYGWDAVKRTLSLRG